MRNIAMSALLLCAAGCTALAYWTTKLALEAELDAPQLGRTVSAEGVELHYVQRGSGRPVVLLHGAFGAVQDYTATIFDPLSHRYRTIAFDRPGHGYSERPARGATTPADQARILHAALVKLGVERPVLVGFSWSGALVLAYALDFPDEVAGIVTVNGVAHPWPGPTDALYTLAAIPLIGPLFTHTLVMPIGKYSARASIERAFDPERVPLFFANSSYRLALRPLSYAANAEEIRGLKECVREQCPRYSELRIPLVIVVAEGDKIVTPELHSHALHAEVPDSELISVPGAGHQLLYAHPKTVEKAIDRVWRMVEERDKGTASASAASK